MADDPDLMALGQEALEEARDSAVEHLREMKASVVNRPAHGRKLSKGERVMRHQAFLGDPMLMETEWASLATRFPPPQEGMIPRRWAEYGRLVTKDLHESASGGEDSDDARTGA